MCTFLTTRWEANLVVFVWVFCLGSGPFAGFASLLFLFGETQIWPGDLRVVGAGGLCFCVCFWFAFCIMKPRRFMLNFLICLLAYPNVRTEPQSEIGRNRGKKQVMLLQVPVSPGDLPVGAETSAVVHPRDGETDKASAHTCLHGTRGSAKWNAVREWGPWWAWILSCVFLSLFGTFSSWPWVVAVGPDCRPIGNQPS